jgi:uncharacterized ferritin-like protein (DUF455 family)
MELRAFAEQILFATTLEEKLQQPANITDLHPGPAMLAPQVPGRPSGLQFKERESGKADFPGLHQLDSERARGLLLHFFANHELLATELMALVLLRFPDAPAAFRRGVLQTLQDEQEHTRLYLARMAACGIEFGELPVSGYFWRAVSGMQSPVDYVAGLSLTFEQANLDFARHFARGFAAAGDDVTAQLLDKIHRDEIVHVAYGLKWFRRWKAAGESDWDAFCRQLKFPLSPQRAKGPVLNVEARRAAGFDPHFIAELDVFSQSKGRTPNVFLFNPFAEAFIAQGRAFTPVKHQTQLARDLANLPQFLGRQDDIVLVPQRPSVEYLSGLKQAGFALPEFVEVNAGALTDLARRKLGVMRPWAWGPDSVERLAPLFASVTGEERRPEQRFNERIAQLYSKAWSADFLRKFLAQSENTTWLCDESSVGRAVSTMPDALAAIAAIRARGHHRVVVKEALGLAGHNSIRLWEPELLATQQRWMAKACEQKRTLVIEPWLERVADFSVQLEMTTRGLKLCGYTGLINDTKGQFHANWAAPDHARRLPDSVIALFREPRDISVRSHRLFGDIIASLDTALREADYLGPVGIDAFVYRNLREEIRLKPVVEINPRFTMGRLTVELMKQTCPGSFGQFRLISLAVARSEGFSDFSSYARAITERHPLRLEGHPTPRLREGVLCLNDPAVAQVCLAVFEVGRELPGFSATVFQGVRGGIRRASPK